MKITTKDIIKVLPFEEEYKKNLLETFDRLEAEKKYSLVMKLWDAYAAYYKIRYQEKVGLAWENAKKGKETLDATLGQRINQQVARELEEELHKTTVTDDLTSVRTKLEAVINEHKKQDYD